MTTQREYLDEELWHGVPVRLCLAIARMMALGAWRRHGGWCDPSDYEAEALAALGACVVQFKAFDAAAPRPTDFLGFFKQRLGWALLDYQRRAWGRPRARRRQAGSQAWARQEVPWGWWDLEREESSDLPRQAVFVLSHLKSSAWEQQLEALVTLQWLQRVVRPSERRAIRARLGEGVDATAGTIRSDSLAWLASHGLRKMRQAVQACDAANDEAARNAELRLALVEDADDA